MALSEPRNLREKFRPRRFTMLLQLPSLPLIAPALRMEPARLGGVAGRIFAMSWLEQILPEPEIRRRQHLGLAGLGGSPTRFFGGKRELAALALGDPVADRIHVSAPRLLAIRHHFGRNLKRLLVERAHHIPLTPRSGRPQNVSLLVDPDHHGHVDEVIQLADDMFLVDERWVFGNRG